MNEVEVEVLSRSRKAEVLYAGVERRECAVVTLAGIAQLGGDEDVLARQTEPRDGLTYLALIEVPCGRVDVSIAGFQRGRNRTLRVFRRRLPNAKSDLRHGITVVEDDQRSSHGSKSARPSVIDRTGAGRQGSRCQRPRRRDAAGAPADTEPRQTPPAGRSFDLD